MSSVSLISVTQPVGAPYSSGITTAEDLIVYCARVSNPANQLNTNTTPKLIAYLIEHKHWSPFEMASMCVEITTSRAIAAQILRHASFSFSEFSQRYSTTTDIEPIELRQQAVTNRQSSTTVIDPTIDGIPATNAIAGHMEASLQLYKNLLAAGVARETARMVLPLATTTKMYMNGTLRSWITYFMARCNDDTQKEHREIAMRIKDIFSHQFPIIGSCI